MKPREIKEERTRFGLSQAALARHIGVRRQTISDWERGVNAPHQTFVKRLREVFAIPDSVEP